MLSGGRVLAPVIWLIMLYTATALTAGVDTSPNGGINLLLFEVRHVAMHLLAFAVQSWLIARALRLSAGFVTISRCAWLVALVFVLGMGQEALQALYRHEVRVTASLWDLVVDTTGGLIGWWWHIHRDTRFPLQSVRGV